MKPHTPSVSRLIAWVFALLIALPLLYFLSVPPVSVLTLKSLREPGRLTPQPAWLKWYTGPYFRLFKHPPFGDPLRDYMYWWEEKLRY